MHPWLHRGHQALEKVTVQVNPMSHHWSQQLTGTMSNEGNSIFASKKIWIAFDCKDQFMLLCSLWGVLAHPQHLQTQTMQGDHKGQASPLLAFWPKWPEFIHYPFKVNKDASYGLISHPFFLITHVQCVFWLFIVLCCSVCRLQAKHFLIKTTATGCKYDCCCRFCSLVWRIANQTTVPWSIDELHRCRKHSQVVGKIRKSIKRAES